MNLQYSPIFKYPRKAFKLFLSCLYPIVIRLYPLPTVKSIPETIDKILNDKVSICRFGDSEFLYLIEKRNLPYQKQEVRLREYFKKILKSTDPNILVGLPIGYYSHNNLKSSTKRMWRAVISWTYPKLKNYLDLDKTYYNASMTRLYMDYEDTTHSGEWFKKVMQIWEDKEVLLIEGEKSRLGVGNDLFSRSQSVQRILGPAHNAFDRFDELLNFAKQHPKNKLILIAMGPTAKPLAYELALAGYQVIDIGNLDIEYEWFIKGVKKKTKIEGKYTSEAKGGRNVTDMADSLYENQIIKKIL